MKNLIFISLLICVFFNGFSQNLDTLLFRKTVFYNIFYHKGKKIEDTATYKVTVKESALKKTLKSTIVDLAMIDGKRIVPLDSIPENTPFSVNKVLTINRNFLKYIPYYEIVHVRTSKHEGFVLPRAGDFKNDEIIVKGIYETDPKVIVYQGHTIIPRDFFLINEKTFEAQRYSCSIESPLWDYLINPISTKSSKPVFVLDGRIQMDGFELRDVREKDINRIEVFDSEDGKKYFGRKGSNGIVAIATKKFTGELLPTMRNIRIIGETEYEMGRWKITSDTIVEDMNAYWNYRKGIFSMNGPVYMIGNEEENSQVNRKTIEMTNVFGIEIKRENKTILSQKSELKIDSTSMSVVNLKLVSNDFIRRDTVFIKTGARPDVITLNNQIDAIFVNLQKMRNGGKMPNGNSSKIPIYIIDNQEITAEKLKQYKPKELEFVESLEGCDAISKYGKRAEFGVVIYRKKKIE
jgi:hypothetical protein